MKISGELITLISKKSPFVLGCKDHEKENLALPWMGIL
jgi:hypothetical protein